MRWQQRVRVATGLSCWQIMLHLLVVALLVMGWMSGALVRVGLGLCVLYGVTVLLMLAVYVLYCLGQLLQNLISARLSQNIVQRMREELFGKIVDLPVQYLDTHSHGDVMSRMTNDVENISTTVSQSLPSLFSGVLTILGTAAIMLWYCWQLALLSLVTVILTAVFAAMAGTGRVTTEQFLTVFTVVIAFYFGTQAEKRARA